MYYYNRFSDRAIVRGSDWVVDGCSYYIRQATVKKVLDGSSNVQVIRARYMLHRSMDAFL